MDNIEIHVVDHCNLNCAHCDNFAPIAKPWYITPGNFKEQLERLNKISHGTIKEVRLMGGEPLLHKKIIELMQIARSIFPYAKVTLLTNGILLLKQKIEFWECLKDNRISVWLSIYQPGNYCEDKLRRYAADVQISHSQTLTNPYAPLFHNLSFDLSGSQNGWNECYLARGRCTTLRNNKIYPCECASLISIFNKRFGLDLQITDSDYMDIYKNTIEEIDEFLKHPIPFCRYCNTAKRKSRYYPHSESKGELSEWI